LKGVKIPVKVLIVQDVGLARDPITVVDQRKTVMIYVFAVVIIKPGMLTRALAAYRALVPQVLAGEPGCLEYAPTVDIDLDLPNQERDADRILVCERWHSVADFRAHLTMPHSLDFRAAIAPCLAEGITVRVTHGAL